jgi:hypothetical protein
MRTFLVDGFVAGTWQIDGETLHVRATRALRKRESDEVAAEADRLIAFAARDATAREVLFSPAEAE